MNSLLARNLIFGIWSLLFMPTMAALKVSDAAPKIQVSCWVQGEEVKEFEGDKVYIVEFWATWCGPCVAAIPHLNEIHQRRQFTSIGSPGHHWQVALHRPPFFIN